MIDFIKASLRRIAESQEEIETLDIIQAGMPKDTILNEAEIKFLEDKYESDFAKIFSNMKEAIAAELIREEQVKNKYKGGRA